MLKNTTFTIKEIEQIIKTYNILYFKPTEENIIKIENEYEKFNNQFKCAEKIMNELKKKAEELNEMK